MTEARTWTFGFAAPDKFLSLNDSKANPYAASRRTKAWREAAFVAAKGAGFPTRLQRIAVHIELCFTVDRDRDEANYQATAKPIVDALGPPIIRRRRQPTGSEQQIHAPGLLLIPDDTPRHLDGQPTIRFGPKIANRPFGPRGLVTVTVTERPPLEETP